MTSEELRLLDAYWRAANYSSVGQIYLLDNSACVVIRAREELVAARATRTLLAEL